MENFFEEYRKQMGIGDLDIRTYSPLTLAYIGDSIYDCMVKLYLVSQGNKPVNTFHQEAKCYVKASRQAEILDRLEPMLTQDEQRIIKWGRNAKSQSIPKHAKKSDYQKATALECLLGYLFLTKNYERLVICVTEGIRHE